MLISKIAEKII
jgi:hypothetical protein